MSGSGLVLTQARQELGEVAWALADVELVDQDVVPTVPAGAGRARQAEDVGAARDRGVGARLQGGGADLLVAQHPEQLAEAGDVLLGDQGQRLGRDVAPGDAGAARGDHDLDLGRRDPLPQLGGDGVAVVLDDAAGDQLVTGSIDPAGQRVARAVVGHGAGVGHGEPRDPQRLERTALVKTPGHGPWPWASAADYRQAPDRANGSRPVPAARASVGPGSPGTPTGSTTPS